MKRRLRATLLIFLGSVSWSLTMVKSGLNYPFGMGFWGPNGHDGVWHIALINSLGKGSLGMPTFAGEALKNYHLGFDLLVAAVHRITSIAAVNLYFQVIPPILAVLIGLLSYKLVLLWRKSEIQALWAVAFVYFGGSLGWAVSLLREGTLGGESMFWSQQSVSTLINPPFALSLVFLLAALILLQKLKEKFEPKIFLLCAVLFGVLVQIKVYGGVLALGALFVSGVWGLLAKKKTLVFKVFLTSAALSLVFLFPSMKNSLSLVVFKPFWFLETMMGFPDRVGWERFYSAMTNYRLGGEYPKAVLAYLVAFAVFIAGNFSTRIIGLWRVMAEWFKKPAVNSMGLFICAVITAGILVPMFFLQEGTAWNSIQFFYYSLFFASIVAGVGMGMMWESTKKFFVRVLLVLVLVLTLPTTYATLGHYLPSRPPAKISPAELEALGFLEEQADGVVLTYPFDRVKAKEAESSPPRPLYLYESTSYVSAFSAKAVFLEDEVNLRIMGYDWAQRRKEVEDFYSSGERTAAREFLGRNSISYIYLVGDQKAALTEDELGISKIFGNREVSIYKVE